MYQIVIGNSTEELSFKVNALLNAGWELVGGPGVALYSATSAGIIAETKKELLITAAEYGNNLIFFQAMLMLPKSL